LNPSYNPCILSNDYYVSFKSTLAIVVFDYNSNNKIVRLKPSFFFYWISLFSSISLIISCSLFVLGVTDQYDTNYITLDLNVLKAHLSNFLLLFGINEVTVMVRIPTDLPL